MKEADIAEQSHNSHYVPEPELFHRVFPFHAVLDEDLSIVQVCARHVSVALQPRCSLVYDQFQTCKKLFLSSDIYRRGSIPV